MAIKKGFSFEDGEVKALISETVDKSKTELEKSFTQMSQILVAGVIFVLVVTIFSVVVSLWINFQNTKEKDWRYINESISTQVNNNLGALDFNSRINFLEGRINKLELNNKN